MESESAEHHWRLWMFMEWLNDVIKVKGYAYRIRWAAWAGLQLLLTGIRPKYWEHFLVWYGNTCRLVLWLGYSKVWRFSEWWKTPGKCRSWLLPKCFRSGRTIREDGWSDEMRPNTLKCFICLVPFLDYSESSSCPLIRKWRSNWKWLRRHLQLGYACSHSKIHYHNGEGNNLCKGPHLQS